MFLPSPLGGVVSPQWRSVFLRLLRYFIRTDPISSRQNNVSIVFLALQRVECGEASWDGPEGSSTSFICVLCPVSPNSPEPGTYRWLWLRGSSVETWCWWSEWAVAGGVWGPLQFHQHTLFWHWRYLVSQEISGSVVAKAFMSNWIACILEIFSINTSAKPAAALWFYVKLVKCQQTVSLKLLFWFFIRKTNVLCRQHRTYPCVENVCESWPAARPESSVVYRHGVRSNNLLL